MDRTKTLRQKWANLNALQRELVRWGILVAVFAVIYVVLRPAYIRYRESDWADSCFTARMHGAEVYMDSVDDLIQAGTDPESIDYIGLIQKAFRDTFGAEVKDDLTITGLCPAGGTMKITIDPDTHELTIACDAEGHDLFIQSDWYWYVNK